MSNFEPGGAVSFYSHCLLEFTKKTDAWVSICINHKIFIFKNRAGQ
jgi:hypothetical protein